MRTPVLIAATFVMLANVGNAHAQEAQPDGDASCCGTIAYATQPQINSDGNDGCYCDGSGGAQCGWRHCAHNTDGLCHVWMWYCECCYLQAEGPLPHGGLLGIIRKVFGRSESLVLTGKTDDMLLLSQDLGHAFTGCASGRQAQFVSL